MKYFYTLLIIFTSSMSLAGAPDLIINEFLADPAAGISGDANGDGIRDATEDEFVELYNNSILDIDVSGWTLSDNLAIRHTFPAATIIPAAGAIVIFGGGIPIGAFGDSLVQTATTGGIGLNNNGDSIILNDGVTDIVTLEYGEFVGIPASNNQSVTLDPDVTGLTYEEHSTTTGSGGSLFSPGTCINGSIFAECLSVEQTISIIINEFLADPAAGISGDANGDGFRDATEDEFVELYNNSDVDVDVSGWTLSDDFAIRHTFPAATIIPAAGAIVIFGGGTPIGSFGGSLVQTATTGGFGLDNNGDSIILNDGVTDIVTLEYGDFVGIFAGNDQSLTLDPDVTGLNYEEHSIATGSGGSLFSPGACINGSDFTECGNGLIFKSGFE